MAWRYEVVIAVANSFVKSARLPADTLVGPSARELRQR
jgi:hypothetical protein